MDPPPHVQQRGLRGDGRHGPAWAAALALAAVLTGKAALEERRMAEVHPRHADYRRRSWHFVPWVL